MKRTTLSFYLVPNGKGKTKRATYRLSEAEARERYPGALPCPFDAIVADEPETAEESEAAMYKRTTGLATPSQAG